MHALKDSPVTAGLTPEPAAASEGWDPGLVWRDRVQLPRLAQELSHAEAEDTRPSKGWDPFQTWQYRVLRLGVGDDPSGD